MLLSEAKQILKKNGYKLNEAKSNKYYVASIKQDGEEIAGSTGYKNPVDAVRWLFQNAKGVKATRKTLFNVFAYDNRGNGMFFADFTPSEIRDGERAIEAWKKSNGIDERSYETGTVKPSWETSVAAPVSALTYDAFINNIEEGPDSDYIDWIAAVAEKLGVDEEFLADNSEIVEDIIERYFDRNGDKPISIAIGARLLKRLA